MDLLPDSIILAKLKHVDQYKLHREAICMFMKWYEGLGANEEYQLRSFKRQTCFFGRTINIGVMCNG